MICSASRAGRGWPSSSCPIEERETLDSGLRQIDFLDGEVALVERAIAHDALNWPDARRLMTVPGVNLIVAVTFLATVGDIHRFPDRRKLVAYLGLDPKVRQSGDAPASARAHLQARLLGGAARAGRGELERRPHPGAVARLLLSASALAAATRSRSARPPANSAACSGRCSGASRTTRSGNRR